MKNKVCVYAICKNESEFVERWYNSMKEADYIVVLDTGSTDDTVEKLKSLGVFVVQKEINPWRFDVARNEAMKLVPEVCNIFVSTDLDEYFDAGWADLLRENWIEGKHERCNYTYYTANDKKIVYNKIHGKGFYWKYPVHEILLKTSDEGLLPETELNLNNSIILYHKPNRYKNRSNYVNLLELRAQEDPKDFYGLYYLAMEYELIDTNKAIEVAKHGIDVSNDNEFYKFVFNVYVGKLYVRINNPKQALIYYIKGLNLCKEFRFVFLYAARILYNTYNDYSGAYSLLMDGLKYSWFHEYWFEEKDGWGAEYYDILSMSAYYSGKKAESLVYAIIASNKDKNDKRLKDNINVIFNQITDKEICNYEE